MKNTLFAVIACALSFGSIAQTYWTGSATVTTSTTGSVNATGGLTFGTNLINNTGLGYIQMLQPPLTLPLPSYKIYVENINNSSILNGIGNVVTNTSTTSQYGFKNELTFSGTSGIKYGIYNNIYSASASPTYGAYLLTNNSSTGTTYGVYSKINSGTGIKYGFYSWIPDPGTSEFRYGIFSDARGTGAKAGMFLGDLEARGKFILSGNTQGRFAFISSPAATTTIGEQSLSIQPNNTSGQDDWDANNALTFFNSGLLQKYTTLQSEKVFTIYRPDLSNEVFQINGNGVVHATEVNVMLPVNFPDYVFQPSYKLMPINEVSNFIAANGHLPNVPSAATVAEEGINLGEMTKVLVEKVEELTLYIIQQQAAMDKQQAEIDALKQQVNTPQH